MTTATTPPATGTPAARRAQLYALLGDLPEPRPIGAKLLGREEREHYVLDQLVLDLNGSEPVPAFFARPRVGAAPFPAVLYNHAHGPRIGKRELIDSHGGRQAPPYAEALARRGIASLCIDQLNFGERYRTAESQVFKELLWHGRVMWGLMVFDNLRALHWLSGHDGIDAARIATVGLSMGSTMAWWTAALDERVKVTIDLCCMTDFAELVEQRCLDEHGLYYYVPGLLKRFDTAAINALIAPRAHLSLNGEADPLTPPRGLDRIDAALTRVYREAGRPEAWRMYRAKHGHFETAEIRAEVLAWLDRWL
jgi:dienelactone hydrolase